MWEMKFGSSNPRVPAYYCDQHVDDKMITWSQAGYDCEANHIAAGLTVPVVESDGSSHGSTVVTGLTGGRVRVTPMAVWHPSVGAAVAQGSMKYGVSVGVWDSGRGVFNDAFLDIETLNSLLVALVEGRLAVEGLS